MSARDRFGLGWRDELAAAIVAHRDAIDIVEVLADDWLERSPREQRALRALGSMFEVALHGTGLGPSSAWPVEDRRVDRLARLLDNARPDWWSEHLAFVRAGGKGGVEIGHLSAPPRSEATIEGTAENIRRVREIIGAAPALENVATLLRPPCSTLSETAWIASSLDAADVPFLLDLHNLHANATNHGYDAKAALAELPLSRVRAVHLAGGRKVIAASSGRAMLLDDHLHPVPDPVYALLEEVAARCEQPLAILIERDGRFPGLDVLLSELAAAREAVARGRARRTCGRPGAAA